MQVMYQASNNNNNRIWSIRKYLKHAFLLPIVNSEYCQPARGFLYYWESEEFSLFFINRALIEVWSSD